MIPAPGNPYDDSAATPDEALEQYNPPPPTDVPTCDTGPEGGGQVPDWHPDTSFVVSGPLGQHAQFPGRRFDTPEAACKWAGERYGHVIAFNTLPGRWFARVPKPRAQ